MPIKIIIHFVSLFILTVLTGSSLYAKQEYTYQLPAGIVDFPKDETKQALMSKHWNLSMRAFTAMAITGNPWTNQFDYPRNNYLNPESIKKQPVNTVIIDPITWTAFPNRVDWYFNTSQGNPYQIPKDLLYPLVDNGRLQPGDLALKKWIAYIDKQNGNNNLTNTLNQLLEEYPQLESDDLSNFAPLAIPTDICPVINWKQQPSEWSTNNFGPGGPRGWKDEYNEWVVTRNKKGQIVKINFTAENPEYWFTLWQVDPNKVLKLYQKLTNKNVQLKDLYLYDKPGKKGKPIKDHNGHYVYNPLNKWNYGNIANAKGGGAVHLTSPPNTVGAEMYLGAAATIIRKLDDSNYNPQQNNCVSLYGSSFRNSDPNIGFQVNQISKNIGVSLTLTNPTSLYMQTPDFSNYITPDGTNAAEFFTIVRGKTAQESNSNYDQILHAVFKVPKEKKYTVSDITIGGQQIWWGAQIAETFNQALAGTAFTQIPTADNIRYPPVSDNPNPNPWAQPLVKYDVLQAVNNQSKINNATIPLLPVISYPGSALVNMAVEAINGKKKATIVYTKSDGSIEEGIKVTLKQSNPMGSSQVSGKHGIYETIIYVIDIHISPQVEPGQYGVRITNIGAQPQISVPGNLIIIKKNLQEK